MACGCQKKKQSYQVVTNGGDGRSVYPTTDVNVAKKVSARYPGSVVKDSSGTIVHRNEAAPAVAKTVTEKPS